MTFKFATNIEGLLIEKYNRTYKKKLRREGALLLFSMSFERSSVLSLIEEASWTKSKMVEMENYIKKNNIILNEIAGCKLLTEKIEKKLMDHELYKKRKITADCLTNDIRSMNKVGGHSVDTNTYFNYVGLYQYSLKPSSTYVSNSDSIEGQESLERQGSFTKMLLILNELLQKTDWKPTLKEVITEEYKK